MGPIGSELPFNVLEGKTLAKVYEGGEGLVFMCDDGTSYMQYHDQDCCESVDIDEIIGDLTDLTNTPSLTAEERSDIPYPGPKGS